MLNMDHRLREYYIIAAMMLALVLYSFVPQYIWYWITNDLRDGRWICSLISNGASQMMSSSVPLAGIEGRFVWAASAFVLLIVLISVVTVSAYVLLSRLKQRRKLVGGILALFLIGVSIVAVYSIEPDYKQYMRVIVAGHDCTLADSRVLMFDFIQYFLVLMQSNASAGTLNILAIIEQLLPLFVFACNILLIVALLSLVLRKYEQRIGPDSLILQFAQFRMLLFLGSAMFTAIALYHMSQYGWLAQIFQAYKNPGVESLRQIQRGVTIYIGTINSIAIVLLFFPPGWILWRRAQRLSQTELPEQTRQVRADWLEEKQLLLFAGPMMRIILAVAPLLASGAIMLLQKAVL